MSEQKDIKVSTVVHQETADDRVHVTHIATPLKSNQPAIEFSFSMDIVSASIMSAQLQIAVDSIHARHDQQLKNKGLAKTFDLKTGRSHA